jgi:hypothetical protein
MGLELLFDNVNLQNAGIVQTAFINKRPRITSQLGKTRNTSKQTPNV